MSNAYYNENDAFAAEWLRKLILFGAIAPGDVDERSIKEVSPDDLNGYEQCHFFAGIGVWSYALRCAGWEDDRPAATASCPCQPFSAASNVWKRGGQLDDERHLWPDFYRLAKERRFPVVFGEQVASKDGLAWLDTVSADMEAADYAGGAFDLCAAGFGAPHIRQRLYFVWLADSSSSEDQGGRRILRPRQGDGAGARPSCERPAGLCAACSVADDKSEGLQRRSVQTLSGKGRGEERDGARRSRTRLAVDESDPGPTNGHWRDADWLFCRDGKWRPVESGTFPLAHGVAGRVGLLRGFGNAIVAPVATGFIEAVMDCIP